MAGYKQRIVIDAQIHFGKPCVAGTRIPVEAVMEIVQEGVAFDQIIDRYYPNLTREDIQACIEFATALVRAEDVHFVRR
jgi:uncharacterized protein (DUF433 family)